MYRIIVLTLFVSFSASAAGMDCAIHPAKDVRNLSALAKVSMADARAAALKALNAPSDAKAKGELEVEFGCLLYSFDVKLAGKSGVEELMIDAGDGKVLSRKHETSQKEAAEQAKDRAAKRNSH